MFDVLASSYASTDWANGCMRLEFLEKYLSVLKGKINVLGADMCGLAKAGYFGATKSLKTYAAVYSVLTKLFDA